MDGVTPGKQGGRTGRTSGDDEEREICLNCTLPGCIPRSAKCGYRKYIHRQNERVMPDTVKPDIKREDYASREEYRKAYVSEYRRLNPERVRANSLAYRQRNREKLRVKQAEFRAVNKEAVNASKRGAVQKEKA